MIIPVKCFTCGKLLADKYRWFKDEAAKKKQLATTGKKDYNETDNRVQYMTKDHTEKTVAGQLLDELGLLRMCCRRHMLTHVDIM